MPTIDPLDLEALQQAEADAVRAERLANEEERNDLKRILSSELGRRFVLRQIARAGVFQLSLDPAHSEKTHLTAFSEGRRSEGLRTLNLIFEHCSELWQVMLKERKV